MLLKLTIKNFALIDYSEIEFNKGLNILSGETGSGKSIIIEALNFVLGAKADKILIKNGENECIVSAEFECVSNAIKDILDSFDVENDDTIIITRKMTIDGKNSVKLNGNTINVSMLKKLTSLLVDVHGQSEHFYLLKNSNQLELIDKYGNNYIKPLKEELCDIFNTYKDILKELDELGGDEHKRALRLDVINYQINEIESAEIKDGEEEELLENKKKLVNQEKIFNSLSIVKDGISQEGNISDILSNIEKVFSHIKDISNEYSELYNRISSALIEINDISDTADNFLSGLDETNLDPQFIENRIETYKTLKRKYGNSYTEIISFLKSIKEEKEKLENFNVLSEKLFIQKEEKEKQIYSLYKKLHTERRNTAKIFKDNVINELKELGFNNSDFDISFNNFPDYNDCSFNSKNGIDNIEFMFSANVGEPMKPLSNIISGGEISRFMLAIKAQSSKFSDISTYIFDEIDAGISGKTAKVVAEKIYKISTSKQIIAITHLPQIAVMGNINFLIYKTLENNKTYSRIKKLSDEDKNLEIIRLIGGDENSIKAKDLACEIIASANKFKENIE